MSYAGDVTPTEAYAALRDDPEAVLIDVRTNAEWSYVGVPDLTELGKQLICIEWVSFPGGAQNPNFTDQVRSVLEGDRPTYLLCRSGVRSVAAAEALTAAGAHAAYNVLEGFEGALDNDGHRDVNGWKKAGLPWRQG